jgi:Flp pilus assembly pilin Flp
MKKLIAFFKDEDGLETVEYAVMGGLLVLAIVTALGLLSGAISGEFDRLRGIITGNGA